MKRNGRLIISIIGLMLFFSLCAPGQTECRKIPLKDYLDKMKGGWVGQIAGVSWGAPTEFKFVDKIMPDDVMPKWQPRMINDAFGQDDLYVEMTFLRSMEEHGLDVSIRQAGIDFANSGYALWCANKAGRTNLRKGIAPPDSSHPKFNKCPNDIDYQIEADFSGLIAPGMPNVAVSMGEKFGRLMNYGDGMYAGQFMGGMYAEAFFQSDIIKVIEAGLKCIPAESQYAEMVRDMLAWYKADPDNWEKTWQLCLEKYRKNPEYQKASNGGIDCKINGACVLMGLLYGKGDLDKTIIISCRSGYDSDCNPSSSAGVLFTIIGFSKLPDRFAKELNEKTFFSHTAYNFPALLDVCAKLARQAIIKEGGRIEKNENGEEIFVIPVVSPKPSKLELSWAPGPITDSKFTETEMKQITRAPDQEEKERLKQGVAKFAPGWQIASCGSDMNPGLHAKELGRKNILVTHPKDKDTACVLSKTMDIASGKKTTLKLVVGHHPKGDWELIVRTDGKEIFKKTIGKDIATEGWLNADVDLTPLAGKTVKVELLNQPTGWSHEAGYWAKIEIEVRDN
ncbi:MAG: ADP-ribosylglycohydrolase family protein [Kiritimatiellae bacterium]|nr:ADP-ribosylglycohydrolase family protein [Kiritimatiellia bacterium]MDD5522505.1 ADP-ribosylglycohydrolase family protein [Kiritimatiellia bacterium]